MSWWISLVDEKGNSVSVERHTEGGTYPMGGAVGATLNVTYNYGADFREVGIDLHPDGNVNGRQAKDTVRFLEPAVIRLGTKRTSDYWEATPGNAGYALSILLKWAKQHPEARWRTS